MAAKINLAFLIFLITLSSVAYSDTLRSLFVVHRHGDRTPVSTYAKDPYNDDRYFPDGWGQLTAAGKSRMYNVGRFLRSSYDGFLTDNIREAQVRSSDKDRCIESTQLVLNGVYKPKGRWVWNDDEKWQPFPVHTVPNYLDSMLYPSSKCPAASAETAKIFNSNYVKSINEKYKNLYKYLSANCGEQFEDVIKVSYLYDTLKNEETANLKIPVWAQSPSVLKQMEELYVISFELMSYTRLIQKFRSGILLNDMVEKFEKTIKNESTRNPNYNGDEPKKLNVYSTHDSMLTVVLAALQVNNRLPPPFGATLVIELHKHNDSEVRWDESSSVKILYLNETQTNKPYALKVPACADTDICTVKQFVSSITDLLVNQSEWDSECKDAALLKDTLKLTSAVLISFPVIIIILKLFSAFKKKNDESFKYEMVPVSA